MTNCPFCNAPLNDETKFCPHCGKKLEETKHNPTFGILVTSGLTLLMFLIFFLGNSSDGSAENIVEEQLKAIENNNFTEAYYAYTSSEFQKITSLDEFKKFLKSFPLFSKSKTITLEKLPDEGDSKLIKGTLKGSEDTKLTVQFQLTKQDEVWKVLNIKILPLIEEVEFDDKPLLDPLKSLHELIKEGSLQKAYDTTTSKGFQEATPFKDFEKFIQTNAVFSHNASAEFYKLSFSNNIGIYNARLKSTSGQIQEVEYSLVKEGNVWKILQIQIFDSN